MFATWGPILAASDGTLVAGVGVTVCWGCFGCSTGLSAGKSEGPDPVLPTPGKGNIGFVAEVPVPVAGVG